MAIMPSALTSRTPASGSMKSSRCSCATSCAPTTFTTSVSSKAWSISMQSVTNSKPSSVGSQVSSFQAQWLNVHVDFPLLQRIALPIPIGSNRYPGIKIHDTRIIRLLEVLLHGGAHLGGWAAQEIHHAVLTTLNFSRH